LAVRTKVRSAPRALTIWPLSPSRKPRASSGLDAKEIDDVILGCAMPEGEQGMNVARIALSAPVSPSKPAP